jgi:hypothetical protein
LPADHLWLRNHNDGQSAGGGDHDRLALRKNWAQIGGGYGDFGIFSLRFFRNDIDARLIEASALWQNRRRPTARARAHDSHCNGGRAYHGVGANFRPGPGGGATTTTTTTTATAAACHRRADNPGGGGASEATDEPQFRTWGEAYGISATTAAQGDFAGDHLRPMAALPGQGP